MTFLLFSEHCWNAEVLKALHSTSKLLSLGFIVFLSGYSNQRFADPSKWPSADGSYTQQQASVVRPACVSHLACCDIITFIICIKHLFQLLSFLVHF